jgi:hypothetical protein
LGATNDEISEAAGFVVIAPGADGGGGGGGIPGGGGGSGGGGMPTTAGGGTPGGSGGGGRKGGGGLFMILIFIQHFLSILKCMLEQYNYFSAVLSATGVLYLLSRLVFQLRCLLYGVLLLPVSKLKCIIIFQLIRKSRRQQTDATAAALF